MIRSVDAKDTKQICEIYNYYVLNTAATFEEEKVSEPEMGERISRVSSSYPWLVLEVGDQIGGYAYATKWRTRSAYRTSVETTIYLSPNLQGQGLGFKLYQVLINDLDRKQFHCAIGGISLPNPSSIVIHEKMGFKKVTVFHEVGRKFDRFIDVGYWQLVL